jgi:hypothetical protein
LQGSQARNVPFRPGEAGDDTGRVAHPRKDDGDRLGGVLCRQDRRCIDCEDHVDLEIHQLGSEGRQAFQLRLGKSVFDDDALSVEIAKITESLLERADQGGRARRAGR